MGQFQSVPSNSLEAAHNSSGMLAVTSCTQRTHDTYHFEGYRLLTGLTLFVGWQEGHPACKTWVCWWWQFDWSIACLIAPVVTITSIVFSSNITG